MLWNSPNGGLGTKYMMRQYHCLLLKNTRREVQYSRRSIKLAGKAAFSTTPEKPTEAAVEAEERVPVEELIKMLDMEELKKFNPKLHAQI